MNRLFNKYGGVYIRGFLMGAADVIPGVSGGTIAFITGIYERLINALNEVDLEAVKLLLRFRFKALMEKIDGLFLLFLAMGIFSAVLILVKPLRYLLATYPEAVWSFFFGLIIASIVIVVRDVSRWTAINTMGMVFGAGIAYWLTTSCGMSMPDTHFYMFIAGVISVIAMILPGISGSFLLVIMDKYEYLIETIDQIRLGGKEMVTAMFSGDMAAFSVAWEATPLLPILVFEMGTLVGILGFSRVLKWLFARYKDLTIATLVGFLIGSLFKIWPWKVTLDTYTDSKGVEHAKCEENIMPMVMDSYFILSVALIFIGFFIVYGIEKYSASKRVAE